MTFLSGALNTGNYASTAPLASPAIDYLLLSNQSIMSDNRSYLHRLQIRTITVRHKSNEPTEEKKKTVERSFIKRPMSSFYNTIISLKFYHSNSLAMDYLSDTNASFLPVSKHQACMEEFNINSYSPPPRPKYAERGAGPE